jgi:hypothetical protein
VVRADDVRRRGGLIKAHDELPAKIRHGATEAFVMIPGRLRRDCAGDARRSTTSARPRAERGDGEGRVRERDHGVRGTAQEKVRAAEKICLSFRELFF